MSAYRGERYKTVVPDTLDLADRARLAIDGIGGAMDPDLYYMMFFQVWYACNPPFMRHHSSDYSCDTKFAESLPMLRLMCGSDRYSDFEAGLRGVLLSRIQDDLYWDFVDPRRPWRLSYNPKFDGEMKDEDVANVSAVARMMRVLVTRREVERTTQLDVKIRGLVEGLWRTAIHREDYSYYPDGGFGAPYNYPRSGWLRTDESQGETEGAEGTVMGYQGHQIQALARWYAMSGDSHALDLAARIVRFCMLPKFWGGFPDPRGAADAAVPHIAGRLPDHSCIPGAEQGHWYSHFHGRAVALRGLLEYARVAGDDRVLEFVRRAYEYTWTLGIPRIGWINCFPVTGNMCEGCALGDIVALAIRLIDAGLGDYWDDVDAVVRNHLVEQQVLRADFLERIAQASPARRPEEYSTDPGLEVSENVIARTLGTFFGLTLPVSAPKPSLMHCCTGNATQGLYYAWEGIVREEGDAAQVNLLLNRAAKLLDIDSYLPYQGKVAIHNKGARRVSVRIPSWVPRREIRCQVSGQPRPLEWVGNYLLLDDLKPGDRVTLQFPVRETTDRYTVAMGKEVRMGLHACHFQGVDDPQVYTCTFRGSTLVDISPRDEAPTSYPLYLRDHMRRDEAPMKEVERFAADRKILRW